MIARWPSDIEESYHLRVVLIWSSAPLLSVREESSYHLRVVLIYCLLLFFTSNQSILVNSRGEN